MNSIISASDLKDVKTGVLYFYANWTPFNRRMVNIINKVESEQLVSFTSIDVDSFPSLVRVYGIESVPELVLLKNSKEIGRAGGLMLISALRRLIREKFDIK